MRKISFLLVVFALLLLNACSNQGQSKEANNTEVIEVSEYTPVIIQAEQVTDVTFNDSLSKVILIRGREIAIKTKKALQKELKKAIQNGGFENAISFCNTRAMEITDSLSVAEQVQIRRLAKKFRNPANEMTENESMLFKGYVIDNMNTNIVRSKVSWNDLGQPVYYGPIKTDAVCLNCHGTVGEQVNPEVAKKIAALYPDDMALDFKESHLRGMWSISFPEYRVISVDRSTRSQPISK